MTLARENRHGLARLIVTIDGSAGSGKSTTASLLASRLGSAYLDTGAMYRAVTLAVLRAGADPENEEEVQRILREADIGFETGGEKGSILLDGKNVENEIRGAAVSNSVSAVSRHASVRREMVGLQRRLAGKGGIVAEGRDLGTVVFPYAHAKIFLVADTEARVRRRCGQLESMGISYDIEDIRRNIIERDRIDSSRTISPLVKPPGSIVIDTSEITIEEQVDIAEAGVMKAHRLIQDSIRSYSLKGGPESSNLYYRVSKWLVRSVFKVLFGLKISGGENLEFGENFIFASNHISYGDPPIVGCALDREVYFLAKKELFVNRFFEWLISKYHAIPIDREGLDRRALTTVIGKLKSGESILMFPQGTRSRDGKLKKLKTGLGFIALKSRSNIMPLYVTGSDDLGACFLRRKKLRVRIGPPIRLDRDYKPEDRKRDYRIISSMVLEEMRILKDGTFD